MNANNVTILASAIGVGGTILGTILGWFLNSLSNRGKLYFTNLKSESTFQKFEAGRMVNSNKADVQYYNFTLKFNVYNSCAYVKILKEIKFVLYYNNMVICEIIPDDGLSERYSHPVFIRDKIVPKNLSPKSIMEFKLTFFIKEEAIEYFHKSNNIKLSYENEKGVKKFIKINTDDFSK